MHKKSFIVTTATAIVVYIVLMLVILSFVFWNTTFTLQENAGSTLQQMLEICNYETEEILSFNEQALALVLRDNEDIMTFVYGDEVKRAVAAQNMLKLLKDTSASSPYIKTLFFYDLVNENYIANPEENLGYDDQLHLEEYIRSLDSIYPGNMPSGWVYQNIGERKYLLRVYKNSKRMLGAVVDISSIFNLINKNEAVIFTVTDGNMEIVEQFGKEPFPDSDDISERTIDSVQWSEDKSHYMLGEKSVKGDFYIFAGMTRSDVLGGFQSVQLAILILIILALIFILVLVIYARRIIYMPFIALLNAMNKISEGDQNQRLEGEAESEEFEKINNSFNQMMDTIINLKMKSYEERIQFDEATLKYVQLQIRPHFFLNALTTIHSMSYQNRNDDIREYIEKLSGNVRYLFKSGLHTVPLSEEIAHAKDYMAMQEILYPGCVFDFIDVQEGLDDYPVPQLIVHTMLENIYKHAVSLDNLTSILISAKMEEKNGEDMCHLTIEDDGAGYPEEFLLQVQEGNVKVKENGHGVGLWNMKTTLNLMYRRDDLIYFSNKEPHGSRIDIWIPKRAKRQSSVWKL